MAVLLRAVTFTLAFMLLWDINCAATFDGIASASGGRRVQDTQLESLIQTSIDWLRVRALYSDYPVLAQYTDELQRVLKPSCKRCYDYFEAVAILRSLGKIINQIIQDDKLDVHLPVIRRSYVAASWLLQRSKLFAWQTSQLRSTVLSTMFRLYVHHTNRAKGRAVSFHHISKCGGTTMCQLAASNRCSNPSMDQEKNCVLDSSLDGPIWMVAHDVSINGATPNTTVGRLDAPAPVSPLGNLTWQERYLINQQFAREPELPMWLMYTCPYTPRGRNYDCGSRNKQAQENRSTFLANERTLSQQHGLSQVCPQFTNAIILRDPVPHVASLMAEVSYRYVRQLAVRHNITSWQPPAWNLTWWETLGPAIVGNYATRTLVGRQAFCRSAGNISRNDLDQAVDSLLGFDVVMTLDRTREIDLVVSTLLGWPARSFSSQPASRVRAVAPKTTRIRVQWGRQDDEYDSDEEQAAALGSEDGLDWQQQVQQQQRQLPYGFSQLKAWLLERVTLGGSSSSSSTKGSEGTAGSRLVRVARQLISRIQPQQIRPAPDSTDSKKEDYNRGEGGNDAAEYADGDEDDHGADNDDEDDEEEDSDMSDAEFERVAASLASFQAPDPPLAPPLTPAAAPEELEAAAATSLVKTSWQERQAALWGFSSVKALGSQLLPEPMVENTQQLDRHGAHLIKVVTNLPVAGQQSTGIPSSTSSNASSSGVGELWHAFPRHKVALTDADMARLEQLTQLDQELVAVADLLLDLDSAWLQSLLYSHHYRKRMKSVAMTYTACGFAGMMPLTDTVQDQVFQPDPLTKSNHWLS